MALLLVDLDRRGDGRSDWPSLDNKILKLSYDFVTLLWFRSNDIEPLASVLIFSVPSFSRANQTEEIYFQKSKLRWTSKAANSNVLDKDVSDFLRFKRVTVNVDNAMFH